MKKLKNRSGFSLIEMLAALVVLVLLVLGMEAGMSAGNRAYNESVFESNSGSLSGILNTTLGDVLRYSVHVRKNDGSLQDSSGNALDPADADFVFTNLEYGITDGYFSADPDAATVQFKTLQGVGPLELVNTGAYPRLRIEDFSVIYHPQSQENNGLSGGYFDISYDIVDTRKDSRRRSVTCMVRQMNPSA